MASVSRAPYVTGAIAASGTASSNTFGTPVATTTLYTAPADSFAIIQLNFSVSGGGGSGDSQGFLIGGVGTSSSPGVYTGLYVGPGQSVQIRSTTGTNAGSAFGNISGVQMKNNQ